MATGAEATQAVMDAIEATARQCTEAAKGGSGTTPAGQTHTWAAAVRDLAEALDKMPTVWLASVG